jgi:hypothetical protein
VVKPLRPLLMGGSLRVSVTIEHKNYPSFDVVVKPLSDAERDEHEADEGEIYAGIAEGKPVPREKIKQARDLRNKLICSRLVSWTIEISPGTVAAINAGTVELLPPHAYPQIMNALYLSAGTILGN